MKRLFIDVKGSHILSSSNKYYNEASWCLCNLNKFSYSCSEGRERERSADFIHCPQDEFTALSEHEMEDTTLLFSSYLRSQLPEWKHLAACSKYNFHF